MSRKSQPKPAPNEAAKPETPAAAATPAVPDPASTSQVAPEPTGAVSAPASAAAEAPAAPVAPKAKAKPAVVVVKGPVKGRWRAARKFTPEPVEIPVEELTVEDLEKLTGDPELTVEIVGNPA